MPGGVWDLNPVDNEFLIVACMYGGYQKSFNIFYIFLKAGPWSNFAPASIPSNLSIPIPTMTIFVMPLMQDHWRKLENMETQIIS